MSRLSVLSNPLLLGFEEIERLIDRTKSGNEGYPPVQYRAHRRCDGAKEKLRITIALAGFTRDQLEIVVEDNQLTVRGTNRRQIARVSLSRDRDAPVHADVRPGRRHRGSVGGSFERHAVDRSRAPRAPSPGATDRDRKRELMRRGESTMRDKGGRRLIPLGEMPARYSQAHRIVRSWNRARRISSTSFVSMTLEYLERGGVAS